MAIKFQYNKTSLQDLRKQLKIRRVALPTIKYKETALRAEVKKAKNKAGELSLLLDETLKKYEATYPLWKEFPEGIIRIEKIETTVKKIAGVEIPVLKEVHFKTRELDLFNKQVWLMDGSSILKELSLINVERDFFIRKSELLEYARKKTTQKVNLYEKVQIPEYREAIAKIKQFLEDQESLTKAAQKLVKNRKLKNTGML